MGRVQWDIQSLSLGVNLCLCITGRTNNHSVLEIGLPFYNVL